MTMTVVVAAAILVTAALGNYCNAA